MRSVKISITSFEISIKLKLSANNSNLKMATRKKSEIPIIQVGTWIVALAGIVSLISILASVFGLYSPLLSIIVSYLWRIALVILILLAMATVVVESLR